jgi:2-amino-4-hydroxy-6-hydroxymethyldihydropteridine diphosphokinase
MSVMPTARSKTKRIAGPPKRVHLSFGSNLGDSRALIRKALRELSAAGIKIVRVSSLYKTEPVDYLDQPWFINCVASVETSLSPHRLLQALISIERTLGRIRGKPKGPRLIDIDILLYENVVVRSARLTIPHTRLTERRFVLVPLREIAPRVAHPVTGLSVSELLSHTADLSRVIRLRKR